MAARIELIKQVAAVVLMLAAASFCFYFREDIFYAMSGYTAERVTSPSGRYTARLSRMDTEFYNYISGFAISDQQTGRQHRQQLDDVVSERHGGVYFEWTPSEHYLVIVTDATVTSHGCDYLLVYAGDGSELVYSSVDDSLCPQGLMADASIVIVELCANDDILFTNMGTLHRLSFASGVPVRTIAAIAVC